MAFQAELRRNPKQWIKSAYTLFFQLPWLPERVLSAANFALLDRGWRKQPLNPDAFTDEDISMYKHALTIHGLTPPLNFYRAGLRYRGDLFGQPQQILSPTLVVWGEDDPFMSSAVLNKLAPWVPTVTVRSLARASHWVQNDSPQFVNKLLIEFLQDCGS
jgi:pimeloyl-ACP methyl ester carboxylesterase